MQNTLQILFVAGFGFVASALVSFLFGLFSGGGSYRVKFDSVASVAAAFLICMFAGPYLALENGTRHWLGGQISVGLFVSSVAVAAIWSFCAGIFVIQLLNILGLV